MASLKSDLYDMYLSWLFELKKHMRRKRILIVAVLSIITPLLFLISPGDESRDFASSNLMFLTLLIILSAAMFMGDSISGEFEKKTGLLVFPTPQSRISIFAGKYLAALTITLMAVSIYYMIVIAQILFLFGTSDIPDGLGESFLVAVLYSSAAVSLIYFFSSIFKKTMQSTLIGFFILFMILPILVAILQSAGVNPWFMVTHSGQLITDLVNPSVGPPSEHDFTPHLGAGIAVMIAYAVAFFAVGTGIANGKDVD